MRSSPFILCALWLLAGAAVPCFGHDEHMHAAPAASAHGGAAAPPAAHAVDAAQAPRLALALKRVPQGIALSLATTRFQYARDHADGAAVAGEGHAHLLIDGRKQARLFAPDYVLPDLARGVHRLQVDLVGNDHAPYTVDGVPVRAEAVLLIGGKPDPAGRQHDIALTLEGDAVHGLPAPGSLRTTAGDVLQLTLSGDRAAALHLHGYDIEAALSARVPLTLYLVTDLAGRFPLARHAATDEASQSAGHGHQALLHLDVYPR